MAQTVMFLAQVFSFTQSNFSLAQKYLLAFRPILFYGQIMHFHYLTGQAYK